MEELKTDGEDINICDLTQDSDEEFQVIGILPKVQDSLFNLTAEDDEEKIKCFQNIKTSKEGFLPSKSSQQEKLTPQQVIEDFHDAELKSKFQDTVLDLTADDEEEMMCNKDLETSKEKLKSSPLKRNAPKRENHVIVEQVIEDFYNAELKSKFQDTVLDLVADDEEEMMCNKDLETSKEKLKFSPLKRNASKRENHVIVKQEYRSVKPKKGGKNKILQSKSLKKFEKCLEKAVDEIKKLGCLEIVSAQYKISKDVIYNKLISRRLSETDMLTKFEENNLIKWILKENEKNCLVYKQHLLERVGKLKKVCKITPVFSKSKFGRMWYLYFLKHHPEIYENDCGILLLSEIDSKTSLRKSLVDEDNTQKTVKKEPTKLNEDITDLWMSFGIKELKVVLHDCSKLEKSPFDHNEKENMPLQSKENSNSDDLERAAVKIEPNTKNQICKQIQNFTVSDFQNNVSSVLNRKIKEEEGGNTEVSKLRPQCKICQKTFCNKAKLLRHSVLHIPKELYTISCNKCNKKFPSNYHFKIHVKISHSANYYRCDKCGKVFKHHTSLLGHRKVHLPANIKEETPMFTCDMCGKSFKYKNSLEAHIIYFHLKEEKKFKCDLCKKSFIKYSDLIRHRFRHIKIKPFSCTYCHRSFSRKYLLREHIAVCTKINIESKKIAEEFIEVMSLD